MDAAATYGHLNVVKWLQENRAEGCTNEVFTEVAKRGRCPMLRHLALASLWRESSRCKAAEDSGRPSLEQ